MDRRNFGRGNSARRAFISRMQGWVSTGALGTSQSMSAPSYPFSVMKRRRLRANFLRKALFFATVANAGDCGSSAPPMEIRTFTPAACALEMRAGSRRVGAMESVPSDLIARKECEIWVSLPYGIWAAEYGGVWVLPHIG